MPTKIRLQRKGKKGQPFYHLVVADGRAPRDGRFIERLGTYNPMTHPATIEIDFDRALYWVQVGAQPTDTARSILSHKGVLLKHHLLKGVTKGALSEEQVEEKFKAWLNEKEEKISRISKDLDLTEKERIKKQLEEEKRINEARAAELAKKRASEKMAARPEVADAAVEAVAETAPEEAVPAADAATPEVVAEEAKAPADSPAEEPVKETKPADEPVKEAKPADEPVKEATPADEPAKEATPADEPAKETTPADEPVKETKPADEPAKETKPADEKEAGKDDTKKDA